MKKKGDNFIYSNQPEPHRARRQKIVSKYPQVLSLCGTEPKSAIYIGLLISLQLISLPWVMTLSPWLFVLVAYCFGASINHWLFILMHEASHYLICRHRKLNDWMLLLCNLPAIVPLGSGYKRYHHDHHNYLGQAAFDVDIPLIKEATWFSVMGLRVVWLILQPFTFAIRPLIVRRKKLVLLDGVNVAVQVLFSLSIGYFFGIKALIYLLISALFSMSLHPLAIHLVAQHMVFNDEQDTNSYYGKMNRILFNAGYHTEHHDFPTIPWSRLPQLRKIAPEFYQQRFFHQSLFNFLYKFLTEKTRSLFSRVHRFR